MDTASDLEATSDDELVRRVAAGDQMACRILMNRYLSRVVSLARRMLGNQADAEEVGQEVFIRVWTHAARWETGRAQFGTWLHRVATNLCLDRLRRRPTEALDSIPDPVSDELRPDQHLECKELGQSMEAALQALPVRQRAALVLTYYQGLSNIQTAEILQTSVDAIESLLGRARRELRASLATEREEWIRKSDKSVRERG